MLTFEEIGYELEILHPLVDQALERQRVIDSGEMAIELAQGKSDRDLLVEIVTTLNRLDRDLQATTTSIEPRVRALENFRWWILGACAALSFTGGLLGHVLLH